MYAIIRKVKEKENRSLCNGSGMLSLDMGSLANFPWIQNRLIRSECRCR